MKKILPLIFTLLFTIAGCFAQQSRPISDQRAIMLMNYLQYSLAQVQKNPNTIVATKEFDSIINNINPTTLKDRDIIEAYNGILNSMTDIKMLDNEKKHAEEMAAKERKAAITQIFSSPGSIFVPGANPIIALAYASVSAGLNYAGARAQINNKKLEKEFQINQSLLKTIDRERAELYRRGANVFQTRNDTNDLIAENVMSSFVDTVNIDDVNTRKARLESQQANMRLFPLYWYALGYAQQETGDYDAALRSYSQYETLLKNESVLRFDEIFCQIQFAKIDCYASQDYTYQGKVIQAAIKALQDEISKATPEMQAQSKFALAVMYRGFGDVAAYERCIAEVQTLNLGSWNTTVVNFSEQLANAIKKENANLINSYLTLVKADYVQELNKVKNYISSVKFSQSKQGGLSVDASAVPIALKLYRNDGEYSDPLKAAKKNMWENALSYEQLTETKTGFFTDSKYSFALVCDDFVVWLYAGYGFWAFDDVAKVVFKKPNTDEPIEIKIDYRDIYLYTLPTFTACMKKDKGSVPNKYC